MWYWVANGSEVRCIECAHKRALQNLNKSAKADSKSDLEKMWQGIPTLAEISPSLAKNAFEYLKEKGNNQEIKADLGKPQLRLVPTEIINCIARVREFGNKKYKDSNSWKRVEKERYVDAMFRHLLKYINDNNSIDEESGLPHLWHLACNVAFLCEMEKE